MENTEETVTTEQQEHQPLIVTENMRSYIYETTKWASFLAIVGFVFTGLMVVSAFTVGSVMSTNPNLTALFGPAATLSPIGFTVLFLAYAFAIFYPSLLMFKYAQKAKLGVLFGEQVSLEEATSKMKSLFKYYGIVTIILISLYIILIVVSIGAAAMLAGK
jgi:hypothetical protein